jgi:hypothetical protein
VLLEVNETKSFYRFEKALSTKDGKSLKKSVLNGWFQASPCRVV